VTVRKAVIPAAGLGTRFLPATKSQPKEMIPVVDKPGIQYVVEEAVRAGIDDILIVTSRGKQTLEDHFDRSLELERHLESVGKLDEAEELRAIARLAEIHFVRQQEPLGFGHAVLMAKKHVGGEPFAVMVADEIVPEPTAGEHDLLPRLLDIHDRTQHSVIAVQRVAREDVSSYGIIAAEDFDGDSARITDMIEKPPIDEAPSDLAARGRYVFTAEIFDELAQTPKGVGGEIQLTDAIRSLAKRGSVHAYVHEGPIYDVGKKLDYLKASIELALRRDDLAKPVKEYLAERARLLD
jgi:UTP--glucose-1-phosphate uridylyltransferase